MAAKPTACLALADGTVFYGMGFGAPGEVVRVNGVPDRRGRAAAHEVVPMRVPVPAELGAR